MTIHFASDHAGYELKQTLISYVRDELQHTVIDHGATSYDPEDDYPDFILRAARAVAESEGNDYGIVIGGSGQGEAMCANRIPGVRAALYYGGDEHILTLSREHNDANILSLGARFLTEDAAREAITLWLKTPFSHDERHMRRITKF